MIVHDISAWPARVLGRACPMVDIGHPFLYNALTLTKLLEANGFEVQKRFRVEDHYPLRYWARLMPLPGVVKRPLLAWLQKSTLGQTPLTLGLGNMGVVARKKDG